MLNNNESAMHTGWANNLEAEHNSGIEPRQGRYCDHCDCATEPTDGLDTECGTCGGDYGGNAYDLIQKLEKKVASLEGEIHSLAMALGSEITRSDSTREALGWPKEIKYPRNIYHEDFSKKTRETLKPFIDLDALQNAALHRLRAYQSKLSRESEALRENPPKEKETPAEMIRGLSKAVGLTE